MAFSGGLKACCSSADRVDFSGSLVLSQHAASTRMFSRKCNFLQHFLKRSLQIASHASVQSVPYTHIPNPKMAAAQISNGNKGDLFALAIKFGFLVQWDSAPG